MNEKILIIEDEKLIADWLRKFFKKSGFLVEIANDGRIGYEMALSIAPDLIVLDLMLPSMDGMEICRRLREESNVPIIMLTAKEGYPDRIKGLDIGADDYVVKPFDPGEVVARAKALLRRVREKVQQVLSAGEITLVEDTQTVMVRDKEVKLSHMQFTLLAAFMRHPNQVLTRNQLIALVYNDDFIGYDRAIDNHILRLRKLISLEDYQPIKTIYGAGYKFVVEGD